MRTNSKIKTMLETAEWIPTLQTMSPYQRIHDDCDGDYGQRLSVIVGIDGDMHIWISGGERFLRFRNFIGGGQSPRTHFALMILAEAIRLDEINPRIDRLHEMTDNAQQQVQKLLENPKLIPGLQPMETYRRVHDDSDGDKGQVLSVIIGEDGDAHIAILGKRQCLRFRNAIGGGGSLRVHRALSFLAEAIRLDNKEKPQFETTVY